MLNKPFYIPFLLSTAELWKLGQMSTLCVIVGDILGTGWRVKNCMKCHAGICHSLPLSLDSSSPDLQIVIVTVGMPLHVEHRHVEQDLLTGVHHNRPHTLPVMRVVARVTRAGDDSHVISQLSSTHCQPRFKNNAAKHTAFSNCTTNKKPQNLSIYHGNT